jgi:hypothetical protein
VSFRGGPVESISIGPLGLRLPLIFDFLASLLSLDHRIKLGPGIIGLGQPLGYVGTCSDSLLRES